MKSAITPLITIKNKKIESASRYLCNQEEIIYASKAQLNYSSNLNLPDEICYVILTYGFIYLFIKEDKELKLKQQICTLSCQDIQFDNGKENDNQPSISFMINSDQNVFTILSASNMDTLYQYIYFTIFIISGGLYSHFNLPKLSPQIPMKFFSIQFCVFKRSLYFIHLDMKQDKIPNSEIDGSSYFNDPKNYYMRQILINPNFHPGTFGDYYGKAIGYEPRLSVIVFSNFNEEFTTILESILINARSIHHIKFTDYNTIAPPFNFEKVPQTSIEKFQFTNSDFSLVENFMNGLINSKIEIMKIKLASIKMQQTDLLNFFDDLNKISCFNNLLSFGLFDLENEHFGEFPMSVFSQFLKAHKKLESVFLSNLSVDGSAVLSEICKSTTTLYEIHLNRLNFDQPLSNEGNAVRLPVNLILADFSQSKFKKATLQSLLELLTSDSEASGLKVNLSFIEPHENTFINAYKALLQANCLPSISEVNWSGNNLSPDLFKFFGTQSHLKHMTLMNLNIQKQGPFFNLFTQVVKKSGITGLEIGSDTFDPEFVVPFIESLKSKEELEQFHFHCQPGQIKIGLAISELIESHPNLKDVVVDIKSLQPDVFLKIGNAIVSSASIERCSLTRCDVGKENPKFGLIVTVMKKILKLKPPSSIEQRTIDLIKSKKKDAMSVEMAFEQDNFDEEEEVH